MIKIGIETESCHLWFQNKKMDIFGFIDKAVEYGYDGVIINIIPKKNLIEGLGALGSSKKEHVKKVAEYIRKHHLFVEVDTRGVDYKHLSYALEIAHMLGADILRTFVTSGDYSTNCLSGSYEKENLQKAGKELKNILPLLEKYGIRLAVENHELEIMEEVVEIVQELNSKWVGILYDCGNALMAWQEPIKACQLSAPYMISTHMKDYKVIENNKQLMITGATMGEGSIPLEEILSIIYHDTGLSRLNIELCNPYASPFQREPGAGGVTKAGYGKKYGTFEIKSFQIPPDIFSPLDIYTYEGKYLEELMQQQLKDMQHAILYIKNLWTRVSNVGSKSA